ncbi:MAG: hypothetical protein FRX48_02315 [Lasallia pustulata]|uniref:Rhodopsin domain-containing protein n=1 Tax=Lasallia pustulata TaxID=136370 RepID=A0A5M8PW99_9LECA|nr:MAG: hypothetical protein FRX48_02315 [Lasallia pustulata]
MAQAVITPENKSPLVEVVTWIMLTIAVLSVIARLTTKVITIRRINLDDYMIITSLLLAIAQSIAVMLQATNGFGQHSSTLSNKQIDAVLQSMYAADILVIASLFFAKVSITTFIKSLKPVPLYRQLCFGLEVVMILWALTAELVTAFRCPLPNPWNFLNRSCVSRATVWDYTSIMSIITDAGLVVLASIIVAHIQIPLSKRIMISAVFGTRIFVIAATIGQIVCINQRAASEDQIFGLWQASISTQVVQCLAIVTSCIPYLKPFMKSLESGLMRADDLHRRDHTGAYSRDVNKNSNSSSGSRSAGLSNKSNAFREHQSSHELDTVLSGHNSGISHTTLATAEGEAFEGDAHSDTSQSRIIRHTRTWTVDVSSAEG